MTITNNNPSQFNFFISNQHIGYIKYYIEYNQITIIWLCILLEENRNKGYGSDMIKMFIKKIKKNMKNIRSIVLIPDKFDGINKNILCNFYEKNGFVQEVECKPVYCYDFF